jgi:hypothetical protein
VITGRLTGKEILGLVKAVSSTIAVVAVGPNQSASPLLFMANLSSLPWLGIEPSGNLPGMEKK